MSNIVRVGAALRIPDEQIGASVIDELFDAETSSRYSRMHILSNRCDRFIGRDAGDNLLVIASGDYYYWDHESDRLILLGAEPSQFITGYDE